jgi:hypothetical protein
MNKKTLVYTGLSLFILSGIAATHPTQEDPHWKNLKIIPKNTNDDQMERIMTQYKKQVGVGCDYCHPYTKPDVFPKRVDFGSEELPAKKIARDMMRMTDKLNKKYFKYKNDYSFESFMNQVITCKTCHRGLPKPRNIRLYF